jgi:hypothetical protein
LRKTAHLWSQASAMDDLDNELDRSIDDQIDETELLPFRYLNNLKFPLRS